jgi:hypothetical protein
LLLHGPVATTYPELMRVRLADGGQFRLDLPSQQLQTGRLGDEVRLEERVVEPVNVSSNQ